MATIAYVRYGVMDRSDVFTAPEKGLSVATDVIIRSPRGVEWGRVTALREQKPGQPKPAGEVLRKANPADYDKQRDIVERQQTEEMGYCRKLIEQHGLPMKLVEAEHLFGGNKIIFFFLSEGRVDFRQLVKDLAKQYRTRIEMRQIGVRDEARLMGQIGPCGNELCCRTFLKALKPVPMKLAKDQKSTLDPAKISGSCGRLKCCLKFEEDLYRDLKKTLPRRGTRVRTPKGTGIVVDYTVLTQIVDVELGDGVRHKVPAAELTIEGKD